MDTNAVLYMVYQIQGASDPNQPDDTLKERMKEIFDKACEVMDRTEFQPD